MRESLRARWRVAGHRERVTEALKGRSAWNKGTTMSEETRLKMQEAQRRRRQREQQLYEEEQKEATLEQVLGHEGLKRLRQYTALKQDLALWTRNSSSLTKVLEI
eukprot:tig00020780_g13753.t1